MTDRPLKVFFSYAAEDDAHRITLEKYLKLLQRQGVIETWHDRKILPGGNWAREIAAELESAEVILLLVSVHFLASDYCFEIEMKRALARHDAGEARVIPIILDHCPWENAPFARLQALPDRAKPITAWERQSEAWTVVANEIRRIAELPSVASAVPAREGGGGSAPPNPERYLAAIREQNSYVEIRGMGAKVTERMDLDQVYTRLTVSAADERVPAKQGKRRGGRKGVDFELDGEETLHRDRPLELRDVLSDSHHAVLVGDPGSGKTTFLRYAAQNLAKAHLGEPDALGRIGLTGPAPFPVFVRLEQVARFLAENPDGSCADDAEEQFYRYLVHMLSGRSYGLAEDYLKRRVLGGNCFVLLDGLDEVPGEKLRERLGRLIENVVIAGKAVQNRHLITCRTRAYEGLVRLAADVATLRLAPLDAAQVEQFADGWSRALFRVDPAAPASPEADEAARYRVELLNAIDENPSGATFSQSPLMLTVLAVVHWNKRKLPEQRAELYESAVEYLLESRRELSRYQTPLRRECLQAVAIAMFEDAEGVQRSLGRKEAIAAARGVLGATIQDATDFLENEELHSGLIVSRTEGEVEFWHLTFQEYLAALELSQADNGWSRVSGYLYDDRWNEVVLLLAGCERRQGGLRAARRMIQRILDTGADRVSKAKAVALVARILRDIRPYGGEPEQGTSYAAMLSETLGIFEQGGELIPETMRAEVAEALGQAGDPRLADPAVNRVRIPGGTFWMGAQKADNKARGYDPDADDDEQPLRRVTVSELRIGRYPVTVTEFTQFLDAGSVGYMNPRNWDPQGWAWRDRERRTEPGAWKGQLSHRNRPVTGVSWYEADAYSRWVGGRLPTEAEWEWVARGADGRKYPWGNVEPTEHHANFAFRLREVAPVGVYPLDAPEHGVRDLAGNVWEWCADWFAPEYPDGEAVDPTGPETGPSRVARGGSFDDVAHLLRSACRGHGRPGHTDHLIGFRVVWVLA